MLFLLLLLLLRQLLFVHCSAMVHLCGAATLLLG
jgi:hypothetical protein